MARIVPDGWREVSATGAAQREIETLALLARGLPEGYTVYHAVHWTNVEQGFSIYGDIDFAVVSPAGELLLIEQQAGFLEETPEGIFKKYPDGAKNVRVQLARQVSVLQSRLSKRPNIGPVRVEYLLYCPDYLVRFPDTAGLAPERIVDADRRDQLCAIIQAAIPPGPPNGQGAHVHRFLSDVIQLHPDTSVMVGRAQAMVTRISGGLTHWAHQLEFDPFRLHVIGTAGSGKTLLAQAEYRDAIDAGKRPLYVCFNRPLADHFAEVAPEGGMACTFHTLCGAMLRTIGTQADFSRASVFDDLVEQAATIPVPPSMIFDTVIVDEGQDFTDHWRDIVLRHAAPDARIVWLEDPMQNLYDKPPVQLPKWVTLHATANYRSPRSVVKLLQNLLPDTVTVEPCGPIATSDVEVMVYDDTAQLIDHTKKAISHCLAAGFKRSDIAVIGFRGREQSALLRQSQLGPHAMRTFTGTYDLFGKPEFSEGDVLMESIYRFKGQAAAAVVFTEIDFEALDTKTKRKLFVGATRAMIKLVLVVSKRSPKDWLDS
ncbi:ATP-binding domain-containing protein [Pigmentiphaga litoralis]|uniref:DNA 3'-5' helicase II n=1 Tax=Pigmentiphaga litoralis TaxID=516702 RepID=A0A7Y9IRE8_9BURK|nr:ATP-binding domain-containing protein [Pigmentiphaga litoralis]NYE24777.1 hypothetical protein [Pigmentiphaga litoralis]NYE81609.1 hypothetical protein [Pigmentiphaga litoralis]